jgi:hypothetical protein
MITHTLDDDLWMMSNTKLFDHDEQVDCTIDNCNYEL